MSQLDNTLTSIIRRSEIAKQLKAVLKNIYFLQYFKGCLESHLTGVIKIRIMLIGLSQPYSRRFTTMGFH